MTDGVYKLKLIGSLSASLLLEIICTHLCTQLTTPEGPHFTHLGSVVLCVAYTCTPFSCSIQCFPSFT